MTTNTTKRKRPVAKPAHEYDADEVRETIVFERIRAAIPSLPEREVIRLARTELAARWAQKTAGRVNKLAHGFREKLAGLGIVGKTIKLVQVTDKHGHVYYEVTSEAGGKRHPDNETLPKGALKGVKVLAD
jgi:hypothetical protein